MNEFERVSRAREARTLVDNPIFAEAVAARRRALLEQFASSEADAVDEWRRIHADLRALVGVQGALRSFVTDGDKAASQSLRRING